MSTIIRIARCLIETLRPLTGSPATGYALVKASGSDVLLPANSYAAPIRAFTSGAPAATTRQIDRENLVRTEADVVVSSSGALVPVQTILGGVRQNLDAATELRWDPPISGVELVSAVGPSPLSGGANATRLGAVNQVVLYEELRSTAVGHDLFRALAEFGASTVIVSWNDSMSPEKYGRDSWVVPERWVMFVVAGHGGGSAERAAEGLETMDAVTALLGERSSINGLVFSAPPTEVLGRRRVAVSENVYVYAVEVKTSSAMEREISADTAEEVYPAEWKRTRLEVLSGRPDETFPVVADSRNLMLLRGFDTGFSGAGFGGRDG